MKNGIAKRGKTYSYVIRVPDPVTGKTKPKWFGGFLTEQEAKVARDKARVTVNSGSYVNPTKMTLEEYLNHWVSIHSNSLKPKTAEDYKGMIARYITPHIGKIQLSQLRASDVQKFYIELSSGGGVDGSPLSARTVTYVGAILKKALAYAVEVEGLIPKNVASKVPMPKGTPKRNEPFTPNQIKQFLDGVRTHRLYPLFRLAIYTGARKGELLALKWTDLDFESGRIVFSKNRVVVRGVAIDQNSTKGGEGRRNIHIDPETLEILNQHRKNQFSERLKAGSEWKESGYIFVTEFGLPIDYGTPTQLFTKMIRRLGLPDQRFHDLRHFHATQLLRAGIPLHVVAQRLGHRDAMVTATTYAHVTADQAENASMIFAKAVE
jgi:integrase